MCDNLTKSANRTAFNAHGKCGQTSTATVQRIRCMYGCVLCHTKFMQHNKRITLHIIWAVKTKWDRTRNSTPIRQQFTCEKCFLRMKCFCLCCVCLDRGGHSRKRTERERGRNAIWRHHNSYSTVSKIWIWIWIAWCDLYFCNNIRIVCSCRSSQLVASKIANIFEQWSQIADRKALRSDIDRCTIIRSLAVRYNFRSLSKFHIFSTITNFAIAPILLLIANRYNAVWARCMRHVHLAPALAILISCKHQTGP